MESVRGAFQMPLQRRLTKMYTDTKSSYEFVKEPTQVAEIPELSTLHRKLRVQKDRLITWGLAWSDTAESPDIDESLSKAGLTDVVGSVMSTIKDILAEAEPLWQASRRPTEDKGKRIGDHKTPIVMWDRGRFEDLVWDLTSSIDTLYDLSRTRRSARHTPPMSASSSFQSPKPDASRLFESSRMLTPQQIDPSCLITDPRDPHSSILVSGPTGVFSAGAAGSRQIVYMRHPTPSTSPRKPSGSWSAVPVLLEYAAYDPVYANTGIHPSMSRFEKLFAGLQMGQDAFSRPDFGALNLIGYFEQSVHAHFGLLYELPNRFAPLDSERPSSFGLPYVSTLSDLLCNPVLEPSLEFKYRLAYNISKTVFDLHSKGIMHGNLAATNIIFLEQQSPVSKGPDPLVDVNIRRAYVTSFDLFPDSAIQQPSEDVYGSSAALYKHPLDPRVTTHTVLTHESRSLDVYSLAMILLEIGLWRPLAEIFPAYLPEDLSGIYKQLAARCGNRYLQAAKACWRAIDDEMSNCSRPEVPLQKVYGRVMRALESCCVPGDGLDEDDNDVCNNILLTILGEGRHTKTLEDFCINVSAKLSKLNEGERPMEVMSNVIKAREEYYKKKALALSLPSPEKQPTKLKIPTNSPSKIKVGLPREATTPKAPELEAVPKPRHRIFLAVKISQEHLDYWHAVLMPQINHALRGFYRKYPESVEVSLESIGETAHKTKPTILVVCTSVSKVRSVLKRSFEYDSSTYGLLVCRGKILRSRKDRPKRSMANETELKPANPDYRERPFSGASIGAYIEGRPLPPVSFGGLIVMDGKPYGLTVHHMLDEPEDPEDDSQAAQHPAFRSSGSGRGLSNLDGESLDHSVDRDEYGYEISEFGSEFGSDTYSEGSIYSDEEQLEDDGPHEPGDTEGIPQDCGRGYVVTQPAMDDVADEMYYSDEEDLLDTYGIGEIYASSGIRRRHEDGSVHEVDWALFKFIPQRLPSGNFVKDEHCRPGSPYPVAVAPWSKLHDLEVHCMARTTGHRTGRILPGMSIVKIFGRQTPSQSYQVSGGLGVPGDSGAWLIDKKQGLACGHVLAWSSRKKVAYICPMQILLKDIAETLDAQSVCFPNAALTETEYGDDASMGQKSALDENPPTPQQGEPLHTGIMKPSLGMRYAISPDDDIVAAMDTMQVSPSVISHG